MEEEKKNAEIGMGTLYDMNKTIVEQNEIILDKGMLNSRKEVIKNFLRKKPNQYYMLLCNERKDYTVFNIGYEENYTIDQKNNCMINILVDECLLNRGNVKGIDITNDKEAIEIWLSIDGESYVYYFFPYDKAVICIEGELELGAE